MENENASKGKMENIFYAALALHVANKPISKENIRVVLRAAGTPIDEAALDIVAAFMESLKASHLKNGSINDPRIIKILTTALTQQKLQVEQLEALLGELSASLPPDVPTGESISNQPAGSPRLDHPEQPAGSITVKSPGAASSDHLAKAGAAETQDGLEPLGRYVYGIALDARAISLGHIGIDGCEVYIVIYRDLGAIVHSCPLEPYQSADDEKVKNWVKAHQNVLDAAKEHFKIIIPMGFDMILKPLDESISSDQMVRDWLKNDYAKFHGVTNRIEGKDEYAVQISYIPSEIIKHMPDPGEDVIRIKAEMARKSPGIAYIYKQKLEKALKADMERLADCWYKDFLNRISQHSDEVIIEKPRKLNNDMVMLFNLSCLLDREKAIGLGEELEKINNMEGFAVHFSGPWPPYSFVNKAIPADQKAGRDEAD